ncbi:MAG TPA: acyl-ACP desaturase [Herpetosiphonaceae bacterium]
MRLSALDQRLEGQIQKLYQAHLERAARIDWSYHQFLPQDLLNGTATEPPPKLSPRVYCAIETALLTEVNLPWFTTELHRGFIGSLEVMLDFVHTWTAEEDQHSTLLETYLLLTRNGNPGERASLRKEVIRQGWYSNLSTAFEAVVYTTIQELATMTFYQNVAHVVEADDPQLARLLRRLAQDETLHYTFYREVVKAHLQIEPNYVWPLTDVMLNFEMPGAGMPNYKERIAAMASDAAYGPEHHYRQVIDVLMRHWDIERLSPTYPEARAAQQKLVDQHARLARFFARRNSRQRAVG